MELKEQALERQYGGRMAMLVLAHGGDITFLHNMAHRNMHRMSPSDVGQFRKECPELYAQYFGTN